MKIPLENSSGLANGKEGAKDAPLRKIFDPPLFKVPDQILSYHILNMQILPFTGCSGNNIAKFIDIQIIANTLTLKLKSY